MGLDLRRVGRVGMKGGRGEEGGESGSQRRGRVDRTPFATASWSSQGTLPRGCCFWIWRLVLGARIEVLLI